MARFFWRMLINNQRVVKGDDGTVWDCAVASGATYRERARMCYGELMDLPVVLRAGEDGFLVAECPAIPGCISQGRTREEALQNIREAIELCLENQLDEGWPLPLEYEIVRVAVG
jgi:predicted RNase H-like HicB family nuclease